MPKQASERRIDSGWSKLEPFRSITVEYRTHLVNQVVTLREAIMPKLKKLGITPIRAQLIDNATAKSHRPNDMFSDKTCPIIGVGKLGELFLLATKDGLDNLEDYIKSKKTERALKEISCLEKIEPITPFFRRQGKDEVEILRLSPQKNNEYITRIRLFDTNNVSFQKKLYDDFSTTCHDNGIIISEKGYGYAKHVYQINCKSIHDIEILENIVGIRSISPMPLINVSPFPSSPNQNSIPLKKIEINQDSPVVVVVDSGVSSSNEILNEYIVGHESTVAPNYQNTDHGTFVAGLICFGKDLNPTLPELDNYNCRIFDLQVLPNTDPKKGLIDSLLESEFLLTLENALIRHANEYKVWNLSLSTNAICSIEEFSAFAEELDNLQEKYEVSFVISAGNYNKIPLLNYPRSLQQLEDGRITSPADSILAISVGAISHVDLSPEGPKINQPSAFSRHGPGPNYIIKPDLIHFGGSCSIDFKKKYGIHSLTSNGEADNLGTSFSAPLVSRTLAQIYYQITPTPSPTLAKALLVHHAKDPRGNQRVPDDEENYFGFGLPTPIPYCLGCTPYSSTLIFDDVLRPGYYLEWDNFPYPSSLSKNGRYYGEISMTLAFTPTRGSRWGTEYCETHIEANFGVYRWENVKKIRKLKFHGLVPPEHKHTMDLHEKVQVEKLRKWAPIRTYYANLNPAGEPGERWRLKLRLLTRHDIEYRPQKFSLIITITDPERKAPIYNEMAQTVRARFEFENLNLRYETRIQTKVENDKSIPI